MEVMGTIFCKKLSKSNICSGDYNSYGQLGTGDTRSFLNPKELNSQYSTIWGDVL